MREGGCLLRSKGRLHGCGVGYGFIAVNSVNEHSSVCNTDSRAVLSTVVDRWHLAAQRRAAARRLCDCLVLLLLSLLC